MTSNTCDGKLVEGIKSISVVTKGTEYVEMGTVIWTEGYLNSIPSRVLTHELLCEGIEHVSDEPQ